MAVKVKGRLAEGVKERTVREEEEEVSVQSRHAVEVKTRDFIIKASCRTRLLEEKEQRKGNKTELKEHKSNT